MMLISYIGYIQGQNGEDLSRYTPRPNIGISFYEVKEFIWRLPEEYRRRFAIRVWTPNTDPTVDETVRVLETISADDFDRQFKNCGYNRARLMIESRHEG
jgi:hypothetical protein